MDRQFVLGLEATPNCTGRSIIDDPMFDSGVYTIICSNCHCIFNCTGRSIIDDSCLPTFDAIGASSSVSS
jgi:hypothetical protein